jgi:peptidyl-dipeptidase Dcp
LQFKTSNQENMLNHILLKPFETPFQVPPFNQIKDEDYLPVFETAIEQARQEITRIAHLAKPATFENTLEALENAGKELGLISRLFFNLNHAHTNEKIQETARKISPLLSDYENDIWLNEQLFQRVHSVFKMSHDQLRDDQKKLLEDTYKGFVRKGALLAGADKERFRAVTKELSQLTLQFGENLLAETNDFKLHITQTEDLDGLPEGAVEAAAALAKSENKQGWLFSLHFPSYMPFMKYASNRELRRQLFMAYAFRGNQNNQHDNKEIIKTIVSLRLEKAQLLGFDTYAAYILEESMATRVDTVNGFLQELLDASLEVARQDVKEVADFAVEKGLEGALQRWDFMYYSEQLKADRLGLDDELVKPYFQLENVEKGIFHLARQLFDIDFKQVTNLPVYHQEVNTYEVRSTSGDFIGILYLDYFPRSSKQGGAWMTSFRDQYMELEQNIAPQVSLVMNFTRPTATKPSLLTYTEVRTFLHEFGHGLHGLLSRVRYESQSGTSVYRDFVELPSQIMENWATEKEWLNQVGIHYLTGEVIPDELIHKLIKSANFQSGYATVRQLSFGLNDMAWHTLTRPFEGDPIEFEKKAMAPTELFPEIEGNCMSTAFSHLFDGGYAAGYYGYKWAEVLDADAFEAFKEKGIFNKEVAQSFKNHILEKGGTQHPMELYKAFRGQEPSIEPLLKRSGLKK